MKKIYLLFFIGVFYVLSSMKVDPKNPPAGQTGAPGETTCSSAVGCHAGGTYNGTVELTGLNDTIIANKQYDLKLTLNSACVRAGFQITALDKANKKIGEFAVGTNCNLTTKGTRQYLRQSNFVTLANKTASYSFKWTAPANITNDSAYFYFVMLQANGNGGTSGDVVAKGMKKAVMNVLSATKDEQNKLVKVFPNPATDYINVSIPDNETADLILTDVAGKKIFETQVQNSYVLDVRAMKHGIYFIKLNGKNINVSKKVFIN